MDVWYQGAPDPEAYGMTAYPPSDPASAAKAPLVRTTSSTASSVPPGPSVPPVPMPPGRDEAAPRPGPSATLATLSGVRDADMDERFAERARHRKARLRFSAKHALAAVLLMVMVTCMSLTLLVVQSTNHAMLDAASVPPTAETGNDADAKVPQPSEPQQSDPQTPEPQASEQRQPVQPADPRLDLNAATLEQLDAIAGIGPVTAKRILDHRNSIGRYASVDQLLDVPGIGAKTLEKIRPQVRV